MLFPAEKIKFNNNLINFLMKPNSQLYTSKKNLFFAVIAVIPVSNFEFIAFSAVLKLMTNSYNGLFKFKFSLVGLDLNTVNVANVTHFKLILFYNYYSCSHIQL